MKLLNSAPGFTWSHRHHKPRERVPAIDLCEPRSQRHQLGRCGMFLIVPILVIIKIVCAHVPSWRWLATWISRDGRLAI